MFKTLLNSISKFFSSIFSKKSETTVVSVPKLAEPPKKVLDWTVLEEGTPEFYRAAYAALEFDKGYESKIAAACKEVLKHKSRYESVAKRAGFSDMVRNGVSYPVWFIIGLIHMKEASCNFNKVLHNGETLANVNKYGTRLVPKGRGKGLNWTWEDAAVDALILNGSRWSKIRGGNVELGEILYAVERYNGTGYITGAGRDEFSPYLWSMSNINDDYGKYVADGKFDPKASTNGSCGFATMLKWLELNGYVKVFSLPSPALPEAPTVPNSTGVIGEGLVELARKAGLDEARVVEMIKLQEEDRPGKNPRYWAMIDMSKHSKHKRFHLFDRVLRTVTSYHVAHGKNSDPSNTGFATKFSNVPNSNCTSLGFYRVAETYIGKYGLSCRLDGKSETNSNARARAIVLHGSDYVGEDYVKTNGKCGRSLGCPAVPMSVSKDLASKLQNGSPLLIYS